MLVYKFLDKQGKSLSNISIPFTWDLKRYYGEEGLVSYLKGLTDTGGNNLGKNPTSVHQLYLPIPQRDLDINPNLVQNPGY